MGAEASQPVDAAEASTQSSQIRVGQAIRAALRRKSTGVMDLLGTQILLWLSFFTFFNEKALAYFNCMTHPNSERTNVRFRAAPCSGEEYWATAIGVAPAAPLNAAIPFSAIAFMVVKVRNGSALLAMQKVFGPSVYATFCHEAYWFPLI